MACPTKNIKFQLRRDGAANWTRLNPVLSAGEPGYESDTNKLKIGNGTNTWNTLPYLISNSAGNILPTADNVYSLGSPTLRWKDVYVGSNTLYVGDIGISSTDSGVLTFQGNAGYTGPVSLIYGGNTLVSDPVSGIYVQNSNGSTGPAVGSTGPTGTRGDTGPTGTRGDTGARGIAFYYGTEASYTGPVGDPRIGDLLINTATGELYMKTV